MWALLLMLNFSAHSYLGSLALLTAVADLGFSKGGFQRASDWSHIAREARALGGCGMWGHVPQENFLISGLLRSLLVPFWGETPRVGRPTAKSSHCVWSQIKRSHNLKAWLRFALRRGKIFLASYCICSVVALWSWEILILTVCHRILSY